MQLMHRLCCRYASTSSGYWTNSFVRSPGSSRTMYGVTDASFSRKSSKSTTRSFKIGKFASGSIVTAPLWTSRMYVPHVSFGWPFTFAPHEPQIPIRHDHRYVSVGSTRSEERRVGKEERPRGGGGRGDE